MTNNVLSLNIRHFGGQYRYTRFSHYKTLQAFVIFVHYLLSAFHYANIYSGMTFSTVYVPTVNIKQCHFTTDSTFFVLSVINKPAGIVPLSAGLCTISHKVLTVSMYIVLSVTILRLSAARLYKGMVLYALQRSAVQWSDYKYLDCTDSH